MTEKKESLLLIYPEVFAKNPGALRVRRMIRSLSHRYVLVLLTKGIKDSIRKMPWGTLLCTKGKGSSGLSSAKSGSFSFKAFKSSVANKILTPDAGVWWNYKVMNKDSFVPFFKECSYVISTSPPHSVHLLAKSLSRKYKLNWLMDMRDGWLDEPLKETLFFLKPFEKIQEKSCYYRSSSILTNTPLWQARLLSRYPTLKQKTKVLINSTESRLVNSCAKGPFLEGRPYLLYAGSFRMSDSRRKLKSIFKPLSFALQGSSLLRICLVGKMNDEDREELEQLKGSFPDYLQIEHYNEMSRTKLSRFLLGAAGFLLSSHSECALPSKFLDYLACRKPVLAFCSKGSSLDTFSQGLSHVYSVDLETPDVSVIKEFIFQSEKGFVSDSKGLEIFDEACFRENLLSFL